MGAFLARQPNGLLCRFSTTLDCPTDWNMTPESFLKLETEKNIRIGFSKEEAEKHARESLKKYILDFSMVKSSMRFYNMSHIEYEHFLKETNKDM